MRGALTAVCGLLLAVPGLYACGTEETRTPQTDSGLPPVSGQKLVPQEGKIRLLRASDIRKFPKGSPERVLLRWWRQIQFNNAGGAVGFYDESAGVEVDELVRQLPKASAVFRGRPVIQDLDRNDERASVYLVVRQEAKTPDGDEVEIQRPVSITLLRVGDEWKIANNLFIEQLVAQAEGAKTKKSTPSS